MSELLPIQDFKIDFNELTSSLTHPELLTETFFVHFFGQLSGDENGEPVQPSEFPCFLFNRPLSISQPLNLNLSLNPSFRLQSEGIEAPDQILVPDAWTQSGGFSLPLEETKTDHPQEHLSGNREEREALSGNAVAIDVESWTPPCPPGREEVLISSKNPLPWDKSHLIARPPSVKNPSLAALADGNVENENPEPLRSPHRIEVAFQSERSPLFGDVGIEKDIPHYVFAEPARTSSEQIVSSWLASDAEKGSWNHVFKEAAPQYVDTERGEGEISLRRSDVEPEGNRHGGSSHSFVQPAILLKRGEVDPWSLKFEDLNPKEPNEPSHGKGHEKAGLPKDFIPLSESPMPLEQIVSMREPPTLQGLKAVLHQGLHGIETLERIARTIAWSARKGEERIEIRLDPPELGTLLIEITKERDVVKATLWTEHQTTKELLEAHSPLLRRILGEDGLRLDRFDLFVHQELHLTGMKQKLSFPENPWEAREILTIYPQDLKIEPQELRLSFLSNFDTPSYRRSEINPPILPRIEDSEISNSHGYFFSKATPGRHSYERLLPFTESVPQQDPVAFWFLEKSFFDGGGGVPMYSHFMVELLEKVGRYIGGVAQKGQEIIKMRLEPPELGTLFVKITKDRDAIKATLWADNLMTKELLDAHKAELRRILGEDGLKLERFDVFIVQQDFNLPGGQQGFPFRENPWHEKEVGEDGVFPPSDTSPLLPAELYRGSSPRGRVDRVV